MRLISSSVMLMLAMGIPAQVNAQPSAAEARTALSKAVKFFHDKVATHGGYVWVYSSDLKYRMGEGLAYDQRIWVQPPGTPAVGLAFMQAYEATGDPLCLKAAREVAEALVQGQLHSGGWGYSITFDSARRKTVNYRIGGSKGKPNVRVESPGGWEVWRKRQHPGNITIVDDDVTPSALRLLMRVDKALNFDNAAIHEAVEYGLASLMKAQFPIGAWTHNYDRFPRIKPDVKFYPILRASYPEQWSRTWDRKFNGCYVLNDRISLNALKTMLDAHHTYNKKEYLEAALLAGEFLLRAQMPEPQPAWAQQYDRHMHPVWDRPFEPPAISGLESQDTLETLLTLYQHTGDKRFLDVVPKSVKYLRSSLLENGKVARFYELKSNRPLYFTSKYKITYDSKDVPDHYGFQFDSRLDAIAAHYKHLVEKGREDPLPGEEMARLAKKVAQVIAGMDARGAWTEKGFVRNEQGRKVVPPDGIIRSETFNNNVILLSGYIVRMKNR